MKGDLHVRFCERGEVEFLAPTRPYCASARFSDSVSCTFYCVTASAVVELQLGIAKEALV